MSATMWMVTHACNRVCVANARGYHQGRAPLPPPPLLWPIFVLPSLSIRAHHAITSFPRLLHTHGGGLRFADHCFHWPATLPQSQPDRRVCVNRKPKRQRYLH